MFELFTIENLLALATLTTLEIILGIDNIVFIAISTDRLPDTLKPKARKFGLFLAMLERIAMLSAISWLAHLTTPLFSIFDHKISGRDLILISGGLFLIVKATMEIHALVEEQEEKKTKPGNKKASFWPIMLQIMLIDTVFSLDSVITAIGMTDNLTIMITAIVLAVLMMMIFANPLSEFILKHPSLKNLALSFLLLIGVFLIAEGLDRHIEKAYLYFAIGFSGFVESINLYIQSKKTS